MADFTHIKQEQAKALELILGGLIFGSGQTEPKILMALNDVCRDVDALREEQALLETPLWQVLYALLKEVLDEKEGTSPLYSDVRQARGVLEFAFEHFVPFYRRWHKDLLAHQPDDTLFNAFSLGTLFAEILQLQAFQVLTKDGGKNGESREDADDSESESMALQEALNKTLKSFDDFVGYRPVPILRSKEKVQAYPHEKVRTIPLYIQGVGVLYGPYYEIVSQALQILRMMPEEILQTAMLDLDELRELSFDPRPLDFDHPVNRRLNYHFGGWDPDLISNKGFYQRFVLIEATIQSILSRVYSGYAEEHHVPRSELMFEAAAVLAGTMLMGARVSGWGPGAHDSSVTFSKLLPEVAQLRDRFYMLLMRFVKGDHAKRLQAENIQLHQPFAGARQYFNYDLARRRAFQYQNVQLARLYAWMGYPEETAKCLEHIHVPSARMSCRMKCLLTQAHLYLDRDQFEEVIPMLYECETLLHDGIECGALLDPWNILGYGGQFPLSDSAEDATSDNRVEDMIMLVSSIFGVYSRLLKTTATDGLLERREELKQRMDRFASWWDQFATTEVSLDVHSISGRETYDSTLLVVDALDAWHQGEQAAGDIAFWRPRIVEFTSTKAYALLIEALLDQHDHVASMALLIHWLSQSELIPLDHEDYTFHPLALRWMEDLWYPPSKEQRLLFRRGEKLVDGWEMAKRFVDAVETNEDVYGVVPELQIDGHDARRRRNKRRRGGQSQRGDFSGENYREDEYGYPEDEYPGDEYRDGQSDEDGFFDEDPEDVLGAAWENVSYRDSTDDGNDSSMEDPDALRSAMAEFPLTDESERISDRLLFLVTRARLWKMAAVFSLPFADKHPDRSEALQKWREQAAKLRKDLEKLLVQVHQFPIEAPDITRPIAMMEYDRKNSLKLTLLERVITTSNELFDAEQLMYIADTQNRITRADTWASASACVMQALVCSDTARVKKVWNTMVDLFEREQILFVPLEREGDPLKLMHIRNILTVLERLLVNLPKQGLITETYRVLTMVQVMERKHPTGHRSITRYDYLFELANKSITSAMLDSAAVQEGVWSQAALLKAFNDVMSVLVKNWIGHSRGIRVSPMDSFLDAQSWEDLKDFIQEYGNDLFAPVHLSYSNLQAILYQGIPNWLRALMDEDEPEMGATLAEDLRKDRCPFSRAAFCCDTVIETLTERYGQFIDYNTTTTYSDRGENLYILLEFLRVMADYDRMAWDMCPLINTHSVIVREKNYELADSWTEEIRKKSSQNADKLLKRYEALCQTYGISVKSVYDRLSERFIKPMGINKLCALLEPAVNEARTNSEERPAFQQFQKLIAEFSSEVSGTGFESPHWLEEVENEAQRYRTRSDEDDKMLDLKDFIPFNALTPRKFSVVMRELESERIMPFIPGIKGGLSEDILKEFKRIAKLNDKQAFVVGDDELELGEDGGVQDVGEGSGILELGEDDGSKPDGNKDERKNESKDENEGKDGKSK